MKLTNYCRQFGKKNIRTSESKIDFAFRQIRFIYRLSFLIYFYTILMIVVDIYENCLKNEIEFGIVSDKINDIRRKPDSTKKTGKLDSTICGMFE